MQPFLFILHRIKFSVDVVSSCEAKSTLLLAWKKVLFDIGLSNKKQHDLCGHFEK